MEINFLTDPIEEYLPAFPPKNGNRAIFQNGAFCSKC
jgi:hypothetical protein